ncbi:MAG: Acetyl-coenzyme synthetase [Labilithrix sp.]|nr:Acetyl-coenzyme synthetase [Labilithrix sp.]
MRTSDPELPLQTTSMADLLEEAARAAPGAPAVHYFDRTITFRELDDLASRFATVLASWGIGRGDRVALYLENVPQYLVALHGTWKRGAVVVLIDPLFEERELAYLIQDSGARVLVALESRWSVAQGVARDSSIEKVVLTSELDLLGEEPRTGVLADRAKAKVEGTFDLLETLAAAAPDPAAKVLVGPDDLASLAYTSGPTGQPKGAMATHANLAHGAGSYRAWMKLEARDVVLGIAPLFQVTGFLAAVTAARCPLVLGFRFDAKGALDLLARFRCTTTIASSAASFALMSCPGAEKASFASLTKAFRDGAPVAPAEAERLANELGLRLHDGYGLVESSSPILAVPLGAPAPVDATTGARSVGIPTPGCDVKLVDVTDPAKEITGAGTRGEIAARGPMITPGYWNKPEATRASLAGGFFLTGEVATRGEDGHYFLVDRKKDVLVVCGHEVWPREVEDTLCLHPAVKEAAVSGVMDAYRGETVKAVVSLKAGAVATPQEIVDFCASKIASYKCPRQVEIADEIPRRQAR